MKNKGIGNKIKEILLEKGITQTYFADKLGMSRRNLDRFFSKNDISINQLRKASEVLDYDFISEFMDSSYLENERISEVPIGRLIKEKLQESGYKQREFAEMMCMSLRNLSYFLDRTDMPISMIIRASSILKKDFIKDYLDLYAEKNGAIYPSEYNTDKLNIEEVLNKYIHQNPTEKDQITVQLNLKANITIISKYFPELLYILKKEASQRGISII